MKDGPRKPLTQQPGRWIVQTLTLVLLLFCAACQSSGPSTAPGSQPQSMGKPMTSTTKLDALKSKLGKSRAEVTQTLKLEANTVEDGYAYEGLKDLAHLYAPKTHSGHFYFHGDKLVMIYGQLLPQTSTQDLIELLGTPSIELASRAGKTSNMAVWPMQGIALSYEEEGEPPQFMEIYAPMTAEEYKTRIYKDPGPFIR